MKIFRWKGLFLVGLLALTFGCDGRFNGTHLKLSGTLEVDEHLVGARVPGRVDQLFVDEGSEVKQGELLATLDRYEQAKKDYERAAQLFEQGGTSEQSVEGAKLALDDQTVVSPVDGIVLVKVHEKGEVVQAGEAILDIGDMSKRWVRVYVPEGLINRVELNQPASIYFDGLSQPFKGRVSFVASKAQFTPRNVQTKEERVTQAFSIKVVVEEPPPPLRPGVAADVVLDLKQG